MQEVLAQWQAKKANRREDVAGVFFDIDASDDQQLMLTDESLSSSSTSDEMELLMDALYSLDVPTLRANLAVHGKPVGGGKDELVASMALTMLG